MTVLNSLKTKMNILAKFKNRKKHKIIFRLQSNNKKFCTVKFSDQEIKLIETAAKSQDLTLEQFFYNILKDLTREKPYIIK